MGVPYQVIAGPFDAYQAPVGEAFPLIDATPAGNWVKIGTGGSQDYSEDGVTVEHSDDVNLIYTLGSTGPRKAFRRREGLIVRFTCIDATLENYRLLMNFNTVTDVAEGAGTAGYRRIDLYRGSTINQKALLIRGLISPYGDAWNMQYQIPVAVNIATAQVQLQKADPMGLAFEWAALEDPNAATTAERFGRLLMQDADPT